MKQLVDPIPRQGLPYGLFSVLDFRLSADPHWQMGVSFETLGCDPLDGIASGCADEGETITGLPKSFTASGGVEEANSFTVYGTYLCSPTGNALDHGFTMAQERLLSREESRVEQALWTGDLDNSHYLSSNDTVAVTGIAPDSSLGLKLGALEQFGASTYGSLGVIHMSRSYALYALSEGVLVANGTRLTTALGTPVVAGAGYGNGDDDAGMAYITPALVAYRSEVFSSSNRSGDLLDTSVNDLYAVAERTYLVAWDDCPVGSIDLSEESI